LRADDLVVTRTDRLEPDRHARTGDGVLGHAHMLESEAVNDVPRGNLDHRGAVVDEVDLVPRIVVVLTSRILLVDAERVVGGDESGVGLAEDTIRTRVVEVPAELLTDAVHAEGVGVVQVVVAVYPLGPDG